MTKGIESCGYLQAWSDIRTFKFKPDYGPQLGSAHAEKNPMLAALDLKPGRTDRL